jgi:rhamnogalacturonyl hydrolase YesR
MKKQNRMGQVVLLVLWALLTVQCSSAGSTTKQIEQLPARVDRFIAPIDIPQLGGVDGRAEYYKVSEVKDMYYVRVSWDLPGEVRQDDVMLALPLAFRPTFNWSPHITPYDDLIIDQHSFRSPALIARNDDRILIVIPDLNIMGKGTPVRWYMDVDARKNQFMLGMSNYRVADHVIYTRAPGAAYPAGEVEMGFYLIATEDKKTLENPFRTVLAFLWDNWGHEQYEKDFAKPVPFRNYMEHTYNWAFNNWKDAVWQEFTIDGKTVGAPVFIVNTTQSPNYPGEVNEREFRSIWNQAWFNSLRSASGLYRYARRTGNRELMDKANMTKELALLFPQEDGLFYGLIGTEMERVEIDGRQYNRSKGWDHYYWGNSNRNPVTRDARRAPFHILDMSWTALLMTRWYNELDRDERLIEYARRYADRLVELQNGKGYFPAWIDTQTLEVRPELVESPETSLSVTFLLELHEVTGEERYKEAALKAMDVVAREIVPVGRWEDFEVNWSCCGYASDHLGRKLERNNMFKQCNFSMFWTAEALRESYRATGTREYLRLGRRVLDEMLMTQASWQPPYIYVSALGGFGVMNADGEWNDSRASLFAELILGYGQELKSGEYTERGLAALKSSFVMMYCPENPAEKQQWEYAWPFFNEKDYGFTMENYGHGGATSDRGMGIGEFTIYDWGNGAAAEAYNRIADHHPGLLEAVSE